LFSYAPEKFSYTSVCSFLFLKSFKTTLFNSLSSWIFWNKQVYFFFVPKIFGLHLFDPLQSKKIWNKLVYFDRFISKKNGGSKICFAFVLISLTSQVAPNVYFICVVDCLQQIVYCRFGTVFSTLPICRYIHGLK